MEQVNLLHIMVVGPLLMYIGITRAKPIISQRDPKDQYNRVVISSDMLYGALGMLGVMLLFIVRLPVDTGIRSIINLVHYVLWVPLFWYVSYRRDMTPSWVFDILSPLGFTVIVVHLVLLLARVKGKALI